MTFAFDRAIHDRAAERRKGDWDVPDALVVVVAGEHLATQGGRLRQMPRAEAPDGDYAFLGDHDGQAYLACIVDRISGELEPQSLRLIGQGLSELEASLVVHAIGLSQWHRKHTFCANCGVRTQLAEAGHTRRCPDCGAHHFPRTDPAVIMLVTDDQDRAMLGRQPAWPDKRFSTLAGFVEPGETLEGAVRREVLEEVGIKVGEVTYQGSQPWPFPSSLMLGFFATATSTEVITDDYEIAEARWFSRDEVSEMTAREELIVPGPLSISRWLIDQWHGGEFTSSW